MRTRFAFAACLAVGLLACANETVVRPAPQGPPGMQAPLPASEQIICEQEKPTGSNIAHTVCRSRADADAERDAGKAWMERTPASPAYPAPSDPFKH